MVSHSLVCCCAVMVMRIEVSFCGPDVVVISAGASWYFVGFLRCGWCVCVCVCVMQVVFLWLDFEMSFFSECMLPGTIVCDLVCGVSKEWGC